MRQRTARLVLAASVLLLAAVPAYPQVFRAYLASDGLDANPCTLPQPCRLLPAAIAAVAAGGEIWMLDSANYNSATVNITKSVTILAVPGALGSVISTGGTPAVQVSTAGVILSLRNLVFAHIAGGTSSYGVAFSQGSELRVSDCEFAGLFDGSINVTAPGAKVSVDRTTFRAFDGAASLWVQGANTRLTVSRSTFISGSLGVVVVNGSRASVSDSVFSDVGTALQAYSGSGISRLAVTRSTISGGTAGVQAWTTSGGTAEIVATDNTISHVTSQVVGVGGAITTYQDLGSASVVADGNTLLGNTNAFAFENSGTIHTRGNNTLKGNTVDVLDGSLTTLSGT